MSNVSVPLVKIKYFRLHGEAFTVSDVLGDDTIEIVGVF